MLRKQWDSWRDGHPAEAKRLLRGGAISILVLLLLLLLFYPHGLYVIGVVTSVALILALLYTDWKT